MATISFSFAVLVWLLFEGGVYFFGKLADSNDNWHAGDTDMHNKCWVVVHAAPQSCCQQVLEHEQA